MLVTARRLHEDVEDVLRRIGGGVMPVDLATGRVWPTWIHLAAAAIAPNTKRLAGDRQQGCPPGPRLRRMVA